jgi:hypothetical protein
MNQISKAPLLIVSAALLTASGPSWTNKPVQLWTEDDAKQILAGSAWVKRAPVVVLPARNESQLRESGRMGGAGQGVGLSALRASILTGIGPKPQDSTSRRRARRRIVTALEVRWESALPVRTAEQAANEDDPPAWDGEMYAIAVYDVPGLDIDDKGLSGELKRAAFLKPDGKKELRPVRVDLLPQEGELTTVVFLFPRSAKITLEDQRIEFAARFGRLSLAQYFYTKEMQFQGKLEL